MKLNKKENNMARKEKGTHVNVSMKKAVHAKAKKIQAAEKLATISDAIDKALDLYNAGK